MRPNVRETVFAGWQVNFNVFTNKTTFTKNNLTVGRLQPLLNIPDLQIDERGLLAWDTLYTGSIDPYRHEKWSLVLTEQTKFDITVNPTTAGLVPAIVLLDSNGNEITRTNGVLGSTQPPGNYFVQIQSDLGMGFYNIIATRDGSVGTTPTPTITVTPTSTSTETPTPTETPTVTVTPTFTETPTSTSVPINTDTPTFTNTPVNTDTPFSTATPIFSETPVITDTPLVTETPIFTNTPLVTETPVFTSAPTSTETLVQTETPIATSTPTVTAISSNTPTPTSTSLPTGPYVITVATPQSLIANETGLVTVSLMNVPVEGYRSAEFTCAYLPGLIEVSNVTIAGLFGVDPVSALNGPQNGSFILAIAGSNGNKAATSGVAFTFNVKGLQAGQTSIECRARVSKGDNTL